MVFPSVANILQTGLDNVPLFGSQVWRAFSAEREVYPHFDFSGVEGKHVKASTAISNVGSPSMRKRIRNVAIGDWMKETP